MVSEEWWRGIGVYHDRASNLEVDEVRLWRRLAVELLVGGVRVFES